MNVNNLFGKGLRLSIFLLICNLGVATAQIGVGTTTPDASSALDVTSTNAGVLFPRMTTAQRNLITNPATGLLIFNISTNTFDFNTGTPGTPNWISLSTGTGSTETRAVKYTNGSGGTAEDFNPLSGAGGVVVNIFGADGLEFNDDTALYVRNDAEQLTITEAGRYRITYVLNLESNFSGGGTSQEFVNVAFRVRVNGTEVGSNNLNGVITNTDGHRLSSVNSSQIFNLNANDVISVATSFTEADLGASIQLLDLENGLSHILIEKIN